MKITDSGIIKTGERELIDSITADLDWDAIEQLLQEKHNFTLTDEVEYKKGDLIIYNDQITYKLDFTIKVDLTLIFDRKGACLKLLTSGGT